LGSAKARVAAIVFVVVALLYANSVGRYLVWTDFFEIRDHHMLAADRATLHALYLPDQLRGENYYRPVQAIVNTVDWWIWHERWEGFHLTNVLLHACCATIVFFLARRIWVRLVGESSATIGAAAAALLWAVTPLKSESVAWIADRCTLLQAFTLLALLRGLALLERLAEEPTFRPRAIDVALLYLLGLLSKETAIVMPLLLALTQWLCRLNVPRAKMVYAPLAIVAAAYLFVRFGWLWFPHAYEAESDLATRVLTQSIVTVDYLRNVIAPFSPRASDVVAIHSGVDGSVAIAIAVLAVLAVIALRFWKRRDERLLAWALAWFAVCVAPTANLLVSQRHFRGDRYVYLASFGIVLAVVALLGRLRRPWPALLGGVFFLATGVTTLVRNREWRANEGDETAFFALEAAREPHFREALGHLCLSYAERREYDRALTYCDAGIEIDPRAWTSTAWQPRSFAALRIDVYTQSGDCTRGLAAARNAIAKYPSDASFRDRLGALLRRCTD
jgi:hypothetical protein